MPTTGRGGFPLTSPWLIRGRRRGNFTLRIYKPITPQSVGSAQEAVFSDWFFEAASTAASISATQTLDGLSQSASLAAIGAISASQLLGGVSQTALLAAIGGISASQTLSALSQSASLTTLAQISASQTLGGLQQSASVATVAAISATQTLDGIQQTANIIADPGTALISATQTLDGLIQSASLTSASEVDTHDGASPEHIKYWLELAERNKPKNRKQRKKERKQRKELSPEPYQVEDDGGDVRVIPASPPVRVSIPQEAIDAISAAAGKQAYVVALESARDIAEQERLERIKRRRLADEEAAILLMVA